MTLFLGSGLESHAQATRLFLVAGQSNCRGTGDSTFSPLNAPGTAFEYSWLNDSLVHLRDPVGEYYQFFQEAVYGSAWPAFTSGYHQITGEVPVIVPCARGGSGITSGAGGAWGDNGALFPRAVSKGKAAEQKTGLKLEGIIWVQGEEDANAVHFGNSTVQEYEDELDSLIAKFRKNFSCDLPFYIVKTGLNAAYPFGPNLAIGQAQVNVAARDPYTYVVYDSAVLFMQLGWMVDGVHYDQTGLNHIGYEVARVVDSLETDRVNRRRLDTLGFVQVCPHEVVTVNGPPGFASYLWSDGTPSATLLAGAPGSYTLQLTDSAGCAFPASDFVQVSHFTPPPKPTISFSSLGVCEGDSILLSVPAGFATYEWNDSTSSPMDTIFSSGTHFVRVSDALGCRSEWSDTLSTTFFPNPKEPEFDPEDTTICAGDTLWVNFANSLGTYFWTDGFVGATRGLAQSTLVSVYLRDSNACDSELADSLSLGFHAALSAPSVKVVGDTVFCQGDSVKLSAPGGYAQYIWSDGSGLRDFVGRKTDTVFVQVRDSLGCYSPYSQQVLLWENPNPPAPLLSPQGPTDFCIGDSVWVQGPPGYNRYLWSQGDSLPAVRLDSAGNYSLVVVDSNGCSSPPSAILNIGLYPLPPSPSVSLSGPSAFCSGDSVMLWGPSGYAQYLWSSGDTTPHLRVDTSGTFTLLVLDSNSCQSPVSLPTLTTRHPNPPAPLISILSGDTNLCQGDQLVLALPSGYGQYFWQDGLPTSQRSISVAGTFSARVTDSNGCLSPWSDSLRTHLFPLPAPPVFSPSADTSLCLGDTLDLLISPPVHPVYTWSSGVSGPQLKVGAPGTYSVTATDTNGCQSLPSPDINVGFYPLPAPPTLIPAGSVDLCDGDSLWIRGPGGYSSYFWSNWEMSDSVRVHSSGSFSLVVRDSNTCLSPPSAPTQVILRPIPPAPQVVNLGDSVFCQGDQTILAAQGGFPQYLWSDGVTTFRDTVQSSGVYRARVFSSFGCESPWSDSLTIRVDPLPPAVSAMFAADSVACEGDTLWAQASPSGFPVYNWIHGQFGQMVPVTSGGVLQVFVQDSNGCESPLSNALQAVFVAVPPTPAIGPDGNGGLTASPGTDFIWLLNGNVLPGQTSGILSPAQPGNYQAISVAAPCRSDTSAPFVLVSDGEDPDHSLFELFPNPTSGRFSVLIHQPGTGRISWKLWTANGKVVAGGTQAQSRFSIALPDGLGAGMYFFEVDGGRGTKGRKILLLQ